MRRKYILHRVTMACVIMLAVLGFLTAAHMSQKAASQSLILPAAGGAAAATASK